VIDRRNARALLGTGIPVLTLCALVAWNLGFSARAAVPAPRPASVPVATEEQGNANNAMVFGALAMGAATYNANDFQGAIVHFTNALKFDPASLQAKQYLANSDLRAYFAGARLPELLAGAIQQYQDILARDPQNVVATEGMAVVDLDAGQFAEARQWALKFVELNAKDPAAYFLATLADFSLAFAPIQQARTKTGLRTMWTGHGMQDFSRVENIQIPDAEIRKGLRDQVLPQIEEGLRMGQKALQLEEECPGVAGYMAQLLRLKAAILDNPAEVLEAARNGEGWAVKVDDMHSARFGPASPLNRVFAPIELDAPPPDPFLSIPANAR
jgi:tetratricopeptide (TPR) repeat protein